MTVEQAATLLDARAAEFKAEVRTVTEYLAIAIAAAGIIHHLTSTWAPSVR